MNEITEGTWARVRLRPDCAGDGHWPHRPAEDGVRVEVTGVGKPGDHSVFALFTGDRRPSVPPPPGGLGLGRNFRPDELDPIPEPA